MDAEALMAAASPFASDVYGPAHVYHNSRTGPGGDFHDTGRIGLESSR
jgi:hypothetical protein